MAGLRSLLQLGGSSSSALDVTELHIYNANKTTQNNGGASCAWTVPTGVTWLGVEMWGGGGGGAGGCCCRSGQAGGSGSYARKFITGLTPGDVYTICAAGSTYCSPTDCVGCVGYPSWVQNPSAVVQVCAAGGGVGYSKCYFQINCSCSGMMQYMCGSWTGGMGICGVTGSAKGSPMCAANFFGIMPSAPYTGGGGRGTMSACMHNSGIGNGGQPHWPGGGGATAIAASTGIQCGAPGAGGLVSIFYGTPA